MNITLNVQADGVPSTRVDSLLRQLAADVRALRSVEVSAATTAAPPGGKSAVQEIAALVITGVFSASTMQALRDVLVAYIERTKVRGVTIRVGDAEVVVTGTSSDDVSKIIGLLVAEEQA